MGRARGHAGGRGAFFFSLTASVRGCLLSSEYQLEDPHNTASAGLLRLLYHTAHNDSSLSGDIRTHTKYCDSIGGSRIPSLAAHLEVVG